MNPNYAFAMPILTTPVPDLNPNKKNVRGPTCSPALTAKWLGELKEAGQLRDMSMRDVLDQLPGLHVCEYIAGSRMEIGVNTSEKGLNNVCTFILPKSFNEVLKALCSPNSAALITKLYDEVLNNDHHTKYASEEFPSKICKEIFRTGLAPNQAFENFIQQISIEIFQWKNSTAAKNLALTGTNYRHLLFKKWSELPTLNYSECSWGVISNPVWQLGLLERSRDEQNGLMQIANRLPGEKLFWALRQYPAWQKVILEKFMLISRNMQNYYASCDVIGVIQRDLIALSQSQSIEELTSQEICDFQPKNQSLKRPSASARGRSTKRGRKL